MENEKLLKELALLGLPLFEAEKYVDVNKVLSDVVRSNNVRLWESFPLLLVNANEKNEFGYNEVFNSLGSYSEKTTFRSLFLLSLAFYHHWHLGFGWTKEVYQNLLSSNEEEYNYFLNSLKNEQQVEVSQRRLNFERMKQVFDNYFKKGEASVKNLRVEL